METPVNEIIARELHAELQAPEGITLTCRRADNPATSGWVVEARVADGGCIAICPDYYTLFCVTFAPEKIIVSGMDPGYLEYESPDCFEELQRILDERAANWSAAHQKQTNKAIGRWSLGKKS